MRKPVEPLSEARQRSITVLSPHTKPIAVFPSAKQLESTLSCPVVMPSCPFAFATQSVITVCAPKLNPSEPPPVWPLAVHRSTWHPVCPLIPCATFPLTVQLTSTLSVPSTIPPLPL